MTHRFSSPLARDLFALGAESLQPFRPVIAPDDADDELNEASYLREEDHRNKYDARFDEMDRRDRAGPQR